MQIIFQVLTALLTIVASLQKEKWKMMLLYTINNLLLIAMYFAFSRTASAYICLIAAIRTFVYMIYSYKKLKPSLYWLILVELGYIATTIIFWSDALDLLPLFAMLVAGFGSWQDNQTVLRISYIINQSLYTLYKLIIGAYISMSVDAICLICTIIALIYYCILKKEKPILQVIFRYKTSKIPNNDIQE